MDESCCQISAIVFTLANSYGSYSAVFSRLLWMFLLLQSNTVCLKKHLLKNLNNTDCEFYFYFFSINLTFFFICFYYALNILTPLYRIGSWNANYTQVCNQNFHWARNPRSYFPFFKKELGRALPLPLLLPANCASDMSPDIHLNAS